MSMQVYVSDEKYGSTTAVEVTAQATVADLIEAYFRSQGKEADGAAIEHAQNLLDPAMKLADAGICAEAVVQVRRPDAISVSLNVRGAFPVDPARVVNMGGDLGYKFTEPHIAAEHHPELRAAFGQRCTVDVSAGAAALDDRVRPNSEVVIDAVLQDVRAIEECRRAAERPPPFRFGPQGEIIVHDILPTIKRVLALNPPRVSYNLLNLAFPVIVHCNNEFAGKREECPERPLEALMAHCTEKLRAVPWDVWCLHYELEPPSDFSPGSVNAAALQGVMEGIAAHQVVHNTFTLGYTCVSKWTGSKFFFTVQGLAIPQVGERRKGPYGRDRAWWQKGMESGARPRGADWQLPFAFIRHIRAVAGKRKAKHPPRQQLTLRWRTLIENVCSRTLRRCGIGGSACSTLHRTTTPDYHKCDDTHFQAMELNRILNCKIDPGEPGGSDEEDDPDENEKFGAAFDSLWSGEGGRLAICLRRLCPGRPLAEYEAATRRAKEAMFSLPCHNVSVARQPAGDYCKPYCCTVNFAQTAPLYFMWAVNDRGAFWRTQEEGTSLAEMHGDMRDYESDGCGNHEEVARHVPQCPEWVPMSSKDPNRCYGSPDSDAERREVRRERPTAQDGAGPERRGTGSS